MASEDPKLQSQVQELCISAWETHGIEEPVGQQMALTLLDGLETNRLVLRGSLISPDPVMCAR